MRARRPRREFTSGVADESQAESVLKFYPFYPFFLWDIVFPSLSFARARERRAQVFVLTFHFTHS